MGITIVGIWELAQESTRSNRIRYAWQTVAYGVSYQVYHDYVYDKLIW